MISSRAPGERATIGADRSRPGVPLTALIALVALAVLLAACGSASSPTPTSSPGSGPDGSAVPRPSRWPGTAVLAIIKLGGIDGEIAKAGADLAKAADAGDPAAMWGAADGLIPVLEDTQLSVEHLAAWDETAELAAVLQEAYPLMLEGATQLRDAITAGDGAGVEEGSRTLAQGLTAYAPARPIIADLVPEALLQQRNLNL